MKTQLKSAGRLGLLVLLIASANFTAAQEVAQDAADLQAAVDAVPAPSPKPIDDAVAAALEIVGQKIHAAKVSRATVELTSRARIGEQELTNDKAVYQIASAAPNRYTVYYKAESQSFRVFCSGEELAVLVSPQAYFKAMAPESMQSVVNDLPVPMGPYPEPIMALTLCGVDPKESLLMDMESVEIVDREPYNNTPAVRLHGVQLDGVTWDLWLATSKEQAQPLKMVVDLTAVVKSDDSADLPENFVFEIEMLFTLWRMHGEVDPKLFALKPPPDAVEYESLDDYYEKQAEQPRQHELVGKPAPGFEATRFNPKDDAKVSGQSAAAAEAKVKLSDLKGKIVVLDFWATWCGPCIEAMPVITKVTQKFADRNVVFYAVNAGDAAADVARFFVDKQQKPDVLLDPEGTVADAYKANAIPQTVIVGKDGRVETVHVGYASLESLEKELTEQLEVLASGGTLLPQSE
ncbi:MAG: TlpA family protein disulfide reductase [Planctomycetaceae bacterium]